MGSQAMIVVVGTLALISIFVTGLMRTGNDLTQNAANAYADHTVKEINNSGIEIALRTLADSSNWRSPLSLQLFGGTAAVTFKDTLFGTDTAVVVRANSEFIAGMTAARARAQIVVKTNTTGFIPDAVNAALTAFGPLDDVLSDMVIDGRDHAMNNDTVIVPGTGKYGVSTGAEDFVNTQNARIGGTNVTTSPPTDIAPYIADDGEDYVEDGVVETESEWPNGWPTTPDSALRAEGGGYWPEGTLKSLAQSGAVPGSQYVTDYDSLKFPVRGITYIEVPSGTRETNFKLGDNPEGILVFHSTSGTNAYAEHVTTSEGVFKGLMIFDNVFHIHLSVVGAMIILSPNTVRDRVCNGNRNKYIKYSSEAIMYATNFSKQETDASWRSRLKVLSWYE